MRLLITKRGTFNVLEFANKSEENINKFNNEGFYYWFSEFYNNTQYDVYIKQGQKNPEYKVIVSEAN